MLKKNFLFFGILSLVIALAASCSEKSDPSYDQQAFTKIYNDNQFSATNYPIDLQQTEDGGYLILCGRRLSNTNFHGIYMLKADKNGNFVKDLKVDETYVNPVGKLTRLGSSYYFFCMDNNTQTYLAQIDQDLTGDIQTVPVATSYPAASSYESNQFILLSYDDGSKESVLSLVNTSGGILTSKGYSIGVGKDVEKPVIQHFTHTGKTMPFSVGLVSGGLYYFNGFFDYTLSLVFTSLSDADEPNGVVYGQEDNGGFSAVASLGGSKFAASRFNFGDNYFIPNITLATSAISNSTQLQPAGNTFPELTPNAVVKLLRAKVNTKNVLIYAADTRSRQIGLFFYDETTGEFLGSRYLGFSNPYEIASVQQTADDGLIVCGTTHIAGRFPRICLFKLTKGELAGIIKQ